MQAAPTRRRRRSTATARKSPATAATAKAMPAARSTRDGATSPDAVSRSGPARCVSVPRRPSEAAGGTVEPWTEGDGVAPLAPAAPAPDLERSLEALRPTALADRDGRHRRPDGIPAATGVAAIVATSGTTGERKGVELTFAGLAASGAAVASAIGGEPGAGWLCCLPLHLVAGLAVVGRAWATGSPFTVQSGFDPAAVVETA